MSVAHTQSYDEPVSRSREPRCEYLPVPVNHLLVRLAVARERDLFAADLVAVRLGATLGLLDRLCAFAVRVRFAALVLRLTVRRSGGSAGLGRFVRLLEVVQQGARFLLGSAPTSTE